MAINLLISNAADRKSESLREAQKLKFDKLDFTELEAHYGAETLNINTLNHMIISNH